MGTPPKTVTILGKRWRFEFTELPNDRDGECEWPNDVDKWIRVRKSLQGQRKLEVLIHEVLHAADWHKDEEWVGRVASDLARFLHRLGYREED